MPKRIPTDHKLSHKPNISAQKMTRSWGNPKRRYFPKGPKEEGSPLFFYLNLKFLTRPKLSKKVTPMDGYGIFNYEHIRNALFSDDVIKNNYNSGLVYVNENRFIVAKLKDHYAPKELNFNDAKDAISIL